MKNKTNPPKNEDFGNPSRDTSHRFALDAFLRSLGYQILRREKNKPPVWVKQGVEYPEPELIKTISPSYMRLVEKQEEAYLNGVVHD